MTTDLADEKTQLLGERRCYLYVSYIFMHKENSHEKKKVHIESAIKKECVDNS